MDLYPVYPIFYKLDNQAFGESNKTCKNVLLASLSLPTFRDELAHEKHIPNSLG